MFLEEASRSRQARQQKRDLGLGTWNVRSLYRADGSSGSGMWGCGLDGDSSGRDRWRALVSAVMNLRVS